MFIYFKEVPYCACMNRMWSVCFHCTWNVLQQPPNDFCFCIKTQTFLQCSPSTHRGKQHWNCKQAGCSYVSQVLSWRIGHSFGGDTWAVRSTWAFSALLCMYSINTSSCGIVCTQMQACLMIITLQLHAGIGTGCFLFFFWSSFHFIFHVNL